MREEYPAALAVEGAAKEVAAAVAAINIHFMNMVKQVALTNPPLQRRRLEKLQQRSE